MLHSNEIKTGNYVSITPYPDKPLVKIVIEKGDSEVCIKDLIDNENGLTLSYKHIYPIILTPDILTNCGFEKAPIEIEGGLERWVISGPGRHIMKTVPHGDIALIEIDLGGNLRYRNIEMPGSFRYLHQLQNAYNELINEALIYQP